jgi:catalase
MSDTNKKLTIAGGCPVHDNQNVMTAGLRGPRLLQDVWFLEKLAHFDREVIPERRMHAKGSGAYMSDNKDAIVTSILCANLKPSFCFGIPSFRNGKSFFYLVICTIALK